MGLCTLAEVKLQLNITGTTDDTELQSYIDAVTGPAEAYVRGPIVQRTVTDEQHRPNGACEIILHNAPVVSISSLVEYAGASALTYTVVSTPASAGSFTVILDKPLAAVTRVTAAGEYPFVGGIVYVTYSAGYASVPAEANLAARIIVQHLWETQRGAMSGPTFGGDDTSTPPGFSFAVPNRARELLDSLTQVASPA